MQSRQDAGMLSLPVSMILTHIPLPLLLVYVRASSLFRLSFQRTQTFMPLHWKKGSGIIYRHKGKTREQGMAMFINHSSRVHFYAYKTRFNVKCYNTLANTWLQTGLQTLAQQNDGMRELGEQEKPAQQEKMSSNSNVFPSPFAGAIVLQLLYASTVCKQYEDAIPW